MASQDWIDQFNANQDLIARVSGYRNPKYDLDLIIPDIHGRTAIAECGHVVTNKEIERNFGWCDRCAQYNKEIE